MADGAYGSSTNTTNTTLPSQPAGVFSISYNSGLALLQGQDSQSCVDTNTAVATVYGTNKTTTSSTIPMTTAVYTNSTTAGGIVRFLLSISSSGTNTTTNTSLLSARPLLPDSYLLTLVPQSATRTVISPLSTIASIMASINMLQSPSNTYNTTKSSTPLGRRRQLFGHDSPQDPSATAEDDEGPPLSQYMYEIGMMYGLWTPSMAQEGLDASDILPAADYSLAPDFLPEDFDWGPTLDDPNFTDAWASYTKTESYGYRDYMLRLFMVNQRLHLLMLPAVSLFQTLYAGDEAMTELQAIRAVQVGLALTLQRYMPDPVPTIFGDNTTNSTFLYEVVNTTLAVLSDSLGCRRRMLLEHSDDPDITQLAADMYSSWSSYQHDSSGANDAHSSAHHHRRSLQSVAPSNLSVSATAAFVAVLRDADGLLVSTQQKIAALNASNPTAVLQLEDLTKQARRLLVVATTQLPHAVAQMADGSLSVDSFLASYTGDALLGTVDSVWLPEDMNELDGVVIGAVVGGSFGLALAVGLVAWAVRRRQAGRNAVAAEDKPEAAAGGHVGGSGSGSSGQTVVEVAPAAGNRTSAAMVGDAVP